MNHQEIKPIIFAQFPKISSSKHRESQETTLDSRGRWINQAMSFKVLAGAVFLLLTIAVISQTTNRCDKPTESEAEIAPVATWNPQVASTTEKTAEDQPASPSPVVANVATETQSKNTAIPAQPATPVTNVMPTVASTDTTPKAVSAGTESPQMSAWPNPNYPTSSAQENIDLSKTANRTPEQIQR